MSLCGLKLASFVRSQVGAGALACWNPVTKYYSAVGDMGRALMKRLSKWATQSRLLFSREIEPDAAEMRPPSEISERSATTLLKWQWLKPFTNIWADNILCTSDLDTIKESTALDDSLPEFHKREIDSLSWTLQHTTNDGEMLPFLEGTPVYLNSHWSDLHFGKPSPNPLEEAPDEHSPAQVLRTVLQHPESTFLSKLDTFISTRRRSVSERDASAVVNALSSLFENKVNPYTEA
ncbi:hypothetical protein C8J56DRAFT_842793, partial [Mycena floridula]